MANTNWKYNPYDTSDHKSQQYLQIKQNLRAILLKNGYDVDEYGQFKRGERSRLQAKLEASQDNYHYPNDALTRLVNRDCEYLDMYCILGLCSLFHVNIGDVLSTTPITFDDMCGTQTQSAADALPTLTDEHYMGDYHCYAFSPNTSSNLIIHFHLSIQKDKEGSVTAEYTYEDHHGHIQKLYGIPKYVPKTEAVEIRLANESGNYYYLYFRYRHYNSSDLYFRKGIGVTSSTSSQEPFAQNFLLFRQELRSEIIETRLPGLLKMTGKYFYVAKSKLESLAEFTNAYHYFIEEESDTLCKVKEQAILSSIDETDREELMYVSSCINQLKKDALAPWRIDYQENVSAAHFARHLMKNTST